MAFQEPLQQTNIYFIIFCQFHRTLTYLTVCLHLERHRGNILNGNVYFDFSNTFIKKKSKKAVYKRFNGCVLCNVRREAIE